MTKEELVARLPGLDEETAEAAVNFVDDWFLQQYENGKWVGEPLPQIDIKLP